MSDARRVTATGQRRRLFSAPSAGAMQVRDRECFQDYAGIYPFSRTGVTVRNGTVRDFDCGVAIEGGSGNTVTGIVAQDNIGAVGATRCAEGVAILSSHNNRIVGNQIVHNGPFGGIGVYTRVDAEHPRTTAGVSRGNLIDSNQVIDNNLPRSAQINDADGIPSRRCRSST